MGPGFHGSSGRYAIVTLICLLAASVGSAAPHKKLPTEELEKYDNPPMYIFRLEASAPMISRFGAFTSVQANVDANGRNVVGDAANEPSITVDPANHNRMSIGWRQFDTVSSNFRQAGWAFSNNGGASWTFPGVLNPGIFRSDPVLGADDTGRLFYLSLLQSFFDDIWRSGNGGMSWARLASATGGDKQWFMIDRTSSSGHGFMYQYWSTAGNNYGGRQFSRSINGGVTWSNPVNIPNSPAWGTLDVDSLGTLYLAGVNLDTGRIWCARSVNAKNAAATPSFDIVRSINLGGDIGSGEPINPEGLVGQVNVAVDRSGRSTDRNVYLLASVQPIGSTTGSDVMIIRSTNFGNTFSAPRRINDDPINHVKWHWFGTLSVAPNGRLDAVWLDSRYAANNTDSQLFYSYSTNGGLNWARNIPVSARFNPFLGYPNQRKMGDYISMVSDSTGADVAYTATFNGAEDVYYVRIAPLGSRLLNISTRARVLTGERVLIAGFVITGTVPKQVVIRGLGPSLASAGLTGLLSNPLLELHQGNNTLATNDNWQIRSDGTSQQAAVVATGLAPTNNFESAIVATLAPGAYTAILKGVNNVTGIGLVEVYDLATTTNSRFINISTRGFVSTGDNVMIGGIVVGAGNGAGARAVVRATGPSLAGSGIQGALQDPMLELHDGNGALVATNDDWKISDQSHQSQEAEVRSTGLQLTDDRESAIVTSLAPGPYTTIVRGKNNTTGVAVVESNNAP